MGLFGRRKDHVGDPSQMSPEEALKLAREGLAKTKTGFNTADQRRKVSPERLAQMEATFDKIEAARARVTQAPSPAAAPASGVASAADQRPASSGDDRIVALERLASLHASEALTDEEFAAEKRRLLES
jgi:hypothetical protein